MGRWIPLAALGWAIAAGTASFAQPGQQPIVFRGMCDASAAVALDQQTFIVADDEQNVFCIYRADRPEQPVARLDWQPYLQIDPDDEHPEADIEGAARLGDEIYWITSHGRNRKGKWRPNRHRLFAMRVRTGEQVPQFEPIGRPCLDLARHLAADPRLAALGLKEALGPPGAERKHLAPKKEGLNIEALAPGPDGRSLWLGFRNPRPQGKALIVALLNPRDVILRGEPPRFGPPVLLPLGVRYKQQSIALGIRAMAWLPQSKNWLIVAGAAGEQKAFAVYAWSGRAQASPDFLAEPTRTIARTNGFSPEAAVIRPAANRALLLSDDGARRVRVASPAECLPGEWEDGWCEAKALLDPARKTFQGLWIALP